VLRGLLEELGVRLCNRRHAFERHSRHQANRRERPGSAYSVQGIILAQAWAACPGITGPVSVPVGGTKWLARPAISRAEHIATGTGNALAMPIMSDVAMPGWASLGECRANAGGQKRSQ